MPTRPRNRPRQLLTALLTLPLAAMALLITSASPAAAVGQFPDYVAPRTTAMTPCPTIAVVGERGSGEALDDGTLGLGGPISAMTSTLKGQLPGVSIGTSAVAYPATPWIIPTNTGWGPVLSFLATAGWSAPTVVSNVFGGKYADSVSTGAEDGASDMTHIAVRCPSTKIIAAGYSQGAQALRGSLNQVSNATAAQIAAVVVFGDAGYIPRESGVTVDGDPAQQGHGIATYAYGSQTFGSRYAGRVLSDCKSTDPICQASYANAYTIGVHFTYGSSSDSAYTAAWIRDLLYPTVRTTAPCETFVADNTIPDGTALTAGTTATKTWTLHNCGATTWTNTTATRISGTAGPATFTVPAVAAGQNGTVSMTFSVPNTPGAYRSTYRLSNAAGAGTGSFWVDFTVPQPAVNDCEAFVADLTLPDDTSVTPGGAYTKSWRLSNCGNTNWVGLTAVRVSGNFGPASFTVPTTAPGSTADISTAFQAPTTAGITRATYRLQAADGHYATNSFWVEINVTAAVNRTAITSYDQMRPGAPYNGYFTNAWQPFTAQSNTLTYISTTIGSPGATPGAAVPGIGLLMRVCTDPNCGQIIAQTQPTVVNYGETGADIGDVAVTPGATYYLVYYQPSQVNGNTWVTYWWAGGPSIGASDQMQGAVRGYNR